MRSRFQPGQYPPNSAEWNALLRETGRNTDLVPPDGFQRLSTGGGSAIVPGNENSPVWIHDWRFLADSAPDFWNHTITRTSETEWTLRLDVVNPAGCGGSNYLDGLLTRYSDGLGNTYYSENQCWFEPFMKRYMRETMAFAVEYEGELDRDGLTSAISVLTCNHYVDWSFRDGIRSCPPNLKAVPDPARTDGGAFKPPGFVSPQIYPVWPGMLPAIRFILRIRIDQGSHAYYFFPWDSLWLEFRVRTLGRWPYDLYETQWSNEPLAEFPAAIP